MNNKIFNDLYIIAEIGTNHNGKIKDAIKLINIAKKSGCNAVKFQSWDETMWSKNFLKKNPSLIKDIQRLSVSYSFLKRVRNYCKKIKIDFSSTPFSIKQVDELISLKPEFIKIASMDLVNIKLIEYCLKFKQPIIISTGLANFKEINQVSKLLRRRRKRNAILLHCVSIYPPKADEMNMLNIKYLQKACDYPIGFSDHSEGSVAAIQALTLGSNVFEKHITINKKIGGPDSEFAADPTDIKEYINDLIEAKKNLGSINRKISSKEINIKSIMRRSAFLNKNILKGEKITWNKIIMQRPGGGLEYNDVKKLINKKSKKDLLSGQLLKKNYFK